MDGSEKPLRIFVPIQTRWATSGHLVGCYNFQERTCCVTAIIHCDVTQIPHHTRSQQPEQLSLLGYLENQSVPSKFLQNRTEKLCADSRSVWLQIQNRDCEIKKVWCDGAWENLEKDSFLIYYDPACITKSAFLNEPVCQIKSSSGDPADCQSIKGNIDFLIHSLLVYKDVRLDLKKAGLKVTPLLKTPLKVPAFVSRVFQAVLQCGIGVLKLCSRLLGGESTWKILNKPAVLCQLNYRWMVVEGAVRDANGTPCAKLRSENAASQQVFDILLGVIVMMFLLQTNYHELFAEWIMSSADWIASELQVLLKWMMGFPAGLKLNSQLDTFLGRFFLYHIYLWTGYLQVLRPILSTLLWYIFVSGCFGITTQLCLIQDLMSMMTLHIYCFYVYAARLYDIQMCGLASLWRLFRGKKWNVLRKRVDSTSFDVDQLFLGTLLFTILLFLLPTTALYYIVFTALRLLVLLVQGSLHKVVSVLSVLPLQSLLYRVLSPETVSDGVFLTVHSPTEPYVPLSLNVQLVPASLFKLWQHSTSIKRHQTYSWKNLGHKLYWGKLIYPWIESQN